MKHKKCGRRVLSLLLALVMVLSLVLPMMPTASADIIAGGNYGTPSTKLPIPSVGSGGTTLAGWASNNNAGSFIKFTLVYYPNGVLSANSTQEGVAYDSVIFYKNTKDSGLYMDSDNFYYFGTSAWDYLQKGYTAGWRDEIPAYSGSRLDDAGYLVAQDTFASNIGLTDELTDAGVAFDRFNDNWGTTEGWGANGDYTSVWGDHQKVDQEVNVGGTKTTLYTASDAFDQLVQKLSDGEVNVTEFTSAWDQTTHSSKYRIFIEPGTIYQLNNSGNVKYFCFTLRELAAYVLNVEHVQLKKEFEAGTAVSGDYLYKCFYQDGNVTKPSSPTSPGGNGTNGSRLNDLARSMYQKDNGLIEVGLDGDGKATGAVQISKLNNYSEKPLVKGIEDANTFFSNAQLPDYCAQLFGMQHLGEYIPNFLSSGQYAKTAGYTTATKDSTEKSLYVGAGLGIISPCSFVSTEERNPGSVTISKTVSGTGDTEKEWNFEIAITKADGQSLTAGTSFQAVWSPDDSATTATSNWAKESPYTFSLVSGQSVTFKDIPTGYQVYVREKEAGTGGYATEVNGPSGLVTGVTADAWQTGTVNGPITFAFLNSLNSSESGKAHLIIDYNLTTGAAATTMSGGATVSIQGGAENAVDCGTFEVGEPITVKAALNGVPLTAGTTVDLYPEKPGTVVAKYRGIYTEATGGTRLTSGGEFTYTLTEADTLTVLYAQWDVEAVPIPDGDGNLYTVFWDQNYVTGGTTSSLMGSFTVDSKVDVSVDVTAGEDGAESSSTSTGEFVNTVEVVFSQPGDPYRLGFPFLGWSKTPLPAVGADGYPAAGTYYPAGTPIPAEDVTGTTTFYALWEANSIPWDANGGRFTMTDTEWLEDGTYTVNADKTVATREKHYAPANNRVSLCKWIPTREGYTFDGWYFDKNCTIPFVEYEWGVQPRWSYYAGWSAQKVIVNYYDTREGTSIVDTQVLDYDDVFRLMPDMNDTSGWTFTGWKVATVSANGSITAGAAMGTGMTMDSSVQGLRYYAGDKHHAYQDQWAGSAGVTSDEGYWVLDLVASWNEEKATYTATIVYGDEGNNDGARPKTLTLGLVSSVTNKEVASATIGTSATAPTDTVSFTGLSTTTADASVEKATYSVYLKSYTDVKGRSYTIKDTAATSGDLTVATVSNASTGPATTYKYTLDTVNTGAGRAYTGTLYLDHVVDTTGDDIKFSVRWDDEDDNDGYRSSDLTLTLYANGTPVEEWTGGVGTHLTQTGTVQINTGMCQVSKDGNSWSYVFQDYQKYLAGGPIQYTVSVSGFNSEKYGLEYLSGGTQYDHVGAVLTHVPERIDELPFSIAWNDQGDRDGHRPEDVLVGLVAHQYNRATGVWEDEIVATRLVEGNTTADVWGGNGCRFLGQYKYHGGKEILYSVTVLSDLNALIPEGANRYTFDSVPVSVHDVMELRISHVRDVRDVPVSVQWDDQDDVDGKRPESIVVQLYADGAAVPEAKCSAILSQGSSSVWTHTFRDVPRYREGGSGEEILYTIGIAETVANSLYTEYAAYYMDADGKDTEALADSASAFVRLEHIVLTADVPVTIIWQDENDRSDHRPLTVDVTLTAYQYDGKGNWQNVTVGKARVEGDLTADRWATTFSQLPVYHGGKKIIYAATVSSDLNALMPKGEAPYTFVNSETTITISRLTDLRDVPVTIHWADDGNVDGKRPSSVLIQLYADGAALPDRTAIVSQDGEAYTWTYTFEDLPRYREGGSGDEILYTIGIAETVANSLYTEYVAHYMDADGGDTEALEDSASAFVRLEHTVLTADVPLTIVWDDQNDRDGSRPDPVTVELTAYQWNGETYRWEEVRVDTATVTGAAGADEWTYVFPARRVYNGGQKIIYKASVISDLDAHLKPGSNGYGWDQGAIGAEVGVTIYHETTVRSVTGTIQWDDDLDNDAMRPASVLLRLYADGQELTGADHAAVVSGSKAADTWSWTFEGLPRYREGKSGEEIVYTVAVEEVVTGSVYGKYVVMHDGEEMILKRYTATYLDAAGQTTDRLDASAAPFVRLTHPIDQGTAVLYASWHDGEDRDGKRPTSIIVDLYAQMGGADRLIQSVTIVAGRNGAWTYTIDRLPVYEDGEPIGYRAAVSEDVRAQLEAIGYTVAVEGKVVHLYYTPETGSVSAQLHWSDGDDNDGIRPDSVIATLLANGKDTGKQVSLDAANGWSATWTGLETYYSDDLGSGQEIAYTVQVVLPDGYAAAYTPASVSTLDGQPISIELRHDSGLRDVPVAIHWNDSRDRDGVRPSSVQVQLLANGRPVEGMSLTVIGGARTDTWTGTFKDLPDYADGERIYYTVRVDDDVDRTYQALVAGTDLYLSYEPEVGDLYVSFRFDDANDADGKRPEGGYLQLSVVDDAGNATPVEGANAQHTIFFEADGTTKDYFRKLPLYAEDGKALRYSVSVVWDDEIFGGAGAEYAVRTSKPVALSTVSLNQLVITASRSADTGTETGHVYWFDNNDQRGNRPSSIIINLYNDRNSSVAQYRLDMSAPDKTGRGRVVKISTGEVVGTVTVKEWGDTGAASVWTYTIAGLQQNSTYQGDHAEIYWSASALDTGLINWYKTTDTGRNGLDINLTHINYLEDVGSSTQDYSVELDWLDAGDAWSFRPNALGVDVTLYANGVAHKSVHLTRANVMVGNDDAWTYTFTKLSTYLAGRAVVWTARVDKPARYTVELADAQADGATFRLAQSTGFDFTVNWQDSDDDDGVRPDSLRVEVYGDGALAGTVTLKPAGSSYTGTIGGLPVWRQTGPSAAIEYGFRWTAETKAELENASYSASATRDGAAVETNGWYWLSATTWGDGEDAGLDELTGTYRWETTLTRDRDLRDVTATVMWQDAADQDGIRPDTVSVQLYADGEPVGEPVSLSAAGDWAWTWTKLPVMSKGKAIHYTADLVETPDGYTKHVQDDTDISLSHGPETVDVTGTVEWLDRTEIRYVTNSQGTVVRTYTQIARVPVTMELLADGEPTGQTVEIGVEGYGEGESLLGWARHVWTGLPRYRDGGTAIAYSFRVSSPELDALLADGHSLTYDLSQPYDFKASVSHDLYDVRGTVYYLYDISDDFLLSGATVTAHLYDTESKTYSAVGSTVTDGEGRFELTNLPQGLLTIRASYQDGSFQWAGSVGVELDRHDAEVRLVVDRDASTDSDLYRYRAQGRAYYQADRDDPSTIAPVPAGSLVLLYRVTEGTKDLTYVGMQLTDEAGAYRFDDLMVGQYVIELAFNYADGTYTYDGADAKADGLTFTVAGADTRWPDIIVQVPAVVEPGPEPELPDEPTPPEPEEPKPCVVSGDVYYSDDGVHSTDPVQGVDVYVYAAGNAAELARTTTDEAGQWSVEGLATGDYILVFALQGNASRVLRLTVSPADYEAGSLTAATQWFERGTSAAPTATIRGAVLDESGKRDSSLVRILDADGQTVGLAYTDANGRYEHTVLAGGTYRVQIVRVGTETEHYQAGDPDDALTELEGYIVSGTFAIDGTAQAGQVAAIYRQDMDLDLILLTATLTDGTGRYSFELEESGNYEVVLYLDGEIYEKHKITVGYQEWEPAVSEQPDGTYRITGAEQYDALELRDTTNDVVALVEHLGPGSSYDLPGLSAGSYDLRLVQGKTEKHYYIDCPAGAIAVDYRVSVSGEVRDEAGRPILGAVVTVYDANGEQVDGPTIITDGSYAYHDLPQGTYQVQIVEPVTGAVLLDRTTAETDSYGVSWPDGMGEGTVWSWNIGAHVVCGAVTDQTGRPIAGAIVILKDDADPTRAYAVATDEAGAWSLGLPDGSYTVDAMWELDGAHVYHAQQAQTIRVDGGDVDEVALTILCYDVSIRIVREGDGQTVPGAQVSVELADGTMVWSGTADDEGQVVLTLMPDGYTISAEHEGMSAQTSVTVSSDLEVELALDVSMWISGTVYEADGQTPAPDAIVWYEGPKSGKVHTDGAGRYRIELKASEAGWYTVYAVAAGEAGSKAHFYVGTDTEQDLYLPLIEHSSETWALTGIVTDETGRRLEDAIVTLRWGDDKAQTKQTSTDRNGAYRFEVEDGTYYLTAIYEAPNGYVYSTNAERTVHVSGAAVSADLAVALGYEVELSVVDEDGTPVAGATVSYTGASTGSVSTGTGGTVSVRLPGGVYDLQAMVGARESAVRTVEVRGPASIVLTVGTAGLAESRPTVQANALSISGYATGIDGGPAAGATVTLWRYDLEAETWITIATKQSDTEGWYEFTGLEDGTYRVDVELVWTDTVEPQPGSYTVSGYAVDEHGAAYVGASVTLYGPDGSVIASTVTGEDGWYEFTDLAAGTYTVYIVPTTEDGALTVTEQTGPSNRLIEGIVLDAAGKPVEGAVVVVTDTDGGIWSMETEADGVYRFDLPAGGEYTLRVAYQTAIELDTETYEPDGSDPNAPVVDGDAYTISGIVLDTDGEPVEGATVVLVRDGKELDRTQSGADGSYEFTGLPAGDYTVTVIFGRDEKVYEVSASGTEKPEAPEPPKPDVDRIHISGVVVTDHKKPLAGVTVTVLDLDGGTTITLTTDADGRFASGELDKARYQIWATVEHPHGSNSSDRLVFSRTLEGVALVVTLSYEADLDGDGIPETVFAGRDDEFDTPDDFYEAVLGGEDIKTPIYAGEDNEPGTEDDWYPGSVAGEDTPIYVGEDTIPGTEDDWYPQDIDGDGEDETVYVGEDTAPGTEDDWYETEEGDRRPVRPQIRFDANGGSVEGQPIHSIPAHELTGLPTAVRASSGSTSYSFGGWYTEPEGGEAVSLDALRGAVDHTTVYAHWTEQATGGTTPGGNTGSTGGSTGGGNTGRPPETIVDDDPPLAVMWTVRFVGADIEDQLIADGELATEPEEPSKPWSKFTGWYTDAARTTLFDFATPITDDLDLYAGWEQAWATTEHIAYIKGYGDGTVRPNADITRAEVAMIFYQVLRPEVRAQYEIGTSQFSDVADGAWYTTAIATLTNMGILKGRTSDRFAPNANITRAEFAAIAARFDELTGGELTFTDVPVTHWAYAEIMSVAAKGWVRGYGDGTFKPNANITRAEAVTLINRVLGRDKLTADGLIRDGMISWPDNDPSAWYWLDILEATNAHEAEMTDGNERWTDLLETVMAG